MRKDGGKIWISSNARMVKDEEGKRLYYEGFVTDITEHKRADAALLEGEKFLASIFSSIQDGISILDTDLNIIRVNQAMESWYAHALPLKGKKCYEAYRGAKKPCAGCPTLQSNSNREESQREGCEEGARGGNRGVAGFVQFPSFGSGYGADAGGH